jgi:hypothetical protein
MKDAITKNAAFIKIGLYVVLAICATVGAHGFYSRYNNLMRDLPAVDEGDKNAKPAAAHATFSQVIVFGGVFFVSAVGLGLLIGHDFSHFVSERFGKIMYQDEGEAIKKTAYEEAEEIWANGNPLEAIQKMRDYLKENPREQHVALRIAEIYEKDLQNPLAAALEYEEVLKQKLQPEQWGWTAIHLCNIYNSKLGKPDKTKDLLRRIVNEYGETSAAEKARKRLSADEGDPGENTAETEPPPPAPAPKPARPINEDLQAHLKRFHQSHQDEP